MAYQQSILFVANAARRECVYNVQNGIRKASAGFAVKNRTPVADISARDAGKQKTEETGNRLYTGDCASSSIMVANVRVAANLNHSS